MFIVAHYTYMTNRRGALPSNSLSFFYRSVLFAAC